MIFKIAGRVRGLFAGNYPENKEDEQFHLNSRGDQIVAQGLPPLTELVRLGNSWQVTTLTASAVTAQSAKPTTTGGLLLWNGEPAAGLSYVIDSVACTEIVVDGTQSDCTALFVMLNKPPVTAPTDAGLLIRSLSGRTYGGRARTLHAGSVTDDGWFPAGNSVAVAAAAAGSGWKQTDVNLNGMYIVPPGGAFNVAACKISGAGSNQCLYTIRWHEVQLIVRS